MIVDIKMSIDYSPVWVESSIMSVAELSMKGSDPKDTDRY